MSLITVDNLNSLNGGADVFELGADLPNNGTKTFNVSSSSYRAIGFRGNSDVGNKFGYVNANGFNGMYGWSDGNTIHDAIITPDSTFFSFSGDTMTFTNLTGSTLRADTVVFIIY